jgi:hypothetical protein
MQRRNGENGSGLGVFIRRYGMVLVLSAAAGALQAQVVFADQKIEKLQDQQEGVQKLLREQAEQNGRIDERTKSIQIAIGRILQELREQNGDRSN